MKKGKVEEEVVDDLTELKYEDLVNLLTETESKKIELNNQRAYLQTERDTIEKLYRNSLTIQSDLNKRVLAEENKLQLEEENHQSEIRIYLQKLKQLEFENERNLKLIEEKGKTLLGEEINVHKQNIQTFKNQKEELKEKYKRIQLDSTKSIQKKEQAIKNILETGRSEFSKELLKYESKNEENLNHLRLELDLKIRTELQEIEERKNFHINDLIKNHEKAFEELKSFYSYITIENLNLIKSQLDELKGCKSRHDNNQQKIIELKEKNKVLEVFLSEDQGRGGKRDESPQKYFEAISQGPDLVVES